MADTGQKYSDVQEGVPKVSRICNMYCSVWVKHVMTVHLAAV